MSTHAIIKKSRRLFVSETKGIVRWFAKNSQSSTSYVEIRRFVIKRAVVNSVVKMPHIKTVANMDG